jgi:hypothetical protein
MPTLIHDSPSDEICRRSTVEADWVRLVRARRSILRLASFFPGMLLILLVGCNPAENAPLVIATTWPASERSSIESLLHSNSDQSLAIQWVSLEDWESLGKAIDRRNGVDLILGAPSWEFGRLAGFARLVPLDKAGLVPWLSVHRSDSGTIKPTRPNDPGFFRLARATLQAEGWPKGYETLVRSVASFSPERGSPISYSADSVEGLALIQGGRNLERARRLVLILEERGMAARPSENARTQAMADAILADLLASSLVDASHELREAGRALVRFNHPAKAEESIGERPPWPPASVTKLRESPNGEILFETLLEQIAPAPSAREWLKTSWSNPRRPIDGSLLLEIAGAADGQLANEPRFRAWLKGEWTAWSRQLYRRVARVAGGYVPS